MDKKVHVKAKYSITVTVLLALPRKTWEDKSFKEVTVTVPLVFPEKLGKVLISQY